MAVESLIHFPNVVNNQKSLFLVVAVDAEFDLHRVWRPQTSGVMAEKWSRS